MARRIYWVYLICLALLLSACDGMQTDSDAQQVDADAPCTSWGRVSTCPDGTIGCDDMICLSHEPQACPPGPWGCAGIDGGAK